MSYGKRDGAPGMGGKHSDWNMDGGAHGRREKTGISTKVVRGAKTNTGTGVETEERTGTRIEMRVEKTEKRGTYEVLMHESTG